MFSEPPKTKGFHRRVTPVWLSNSRQTRKCKYSNHDDYLFNLGIFLFGFQRQCFEVGLQKFDKFLHRILHLLAILSTFCLLFFSFAVFFSRKFFESLLLCGYLPYKFHVNLVFCLFFRTFLCVKPPLFMWIFHVLDEIFQWNTLLYPSRNLSCWKIKCLCFLLGIFFLVDSWRDVS